MSELHRMITAWREYPEDYGAAPDDLIRLCESAWKPVSEPPTEEDGNIVGEVIVCHRNDAAPEIMHWAAVTEWTNQECYWARIEDVVLLPQSNEK